MSKIKKNDNYMKNKNVNRSSDFAIPGPSKVPTVKKSNKSSSRIKNQFGEVKGRTKLSNSPPPSLFGFNWQEFNYLQNVLIDDGCNNEDGIECSSLSSISTSTMTKTVDESLTKLQYLMGLPSNLEEESIEILPQKPQKIVQQLEDSSDTLAMQRAKKYLETHKISQFFQFLTAHLLATKSDKPIDFLIELLDKCLIYRTGLGEPPLLYNEQHLEQLFYLMDRMKTNFIDYNQYTTAMLTLGIVNYCKRPALSANKMISKDYFMAEALKCLMVELNEMIAKRSDTSSKTVSNVTPPPSLATSKSNNLRDG